MTEKGKTIAGVGAFIAVLVGGCALVSIPARDAIYPAPSAVLLETFQKELDQDGVPVSADTIIACHRGGNTMVGEGVFRGTWEGFLLQLGAEKVLHEPGCFFISTQAGDHAILKPLGGPRVRVVLGWPLEGQESGLLRREMESGVGRHRPYRNP